MRPGFPSGVIFTALGPTAAAIRVSTGQRWMALLRGKNKSYYTDEQIASALE